MEKTLLAKRPNFSQLGEIVDRDHVKAREREHCSDVKIMEFSGTINRGRLGIGNIGQLLLVCYHMKTYFHGVVPRLFCSSAS